MVDPHCYGFEIIALRNLIDNSVLFTNQTKIQGWTIEVEKIRGVRPLLPNLI